MRIVIHDQGGRSNRSSHGRSSRVTLLVFCFFGSELMRVPTKRRRLSLSQPARNSCVPARRQRQLQKAKPKYAPKTALNETGPKTPRGVVRRNVPARKSKHKP